MATNIKNVSDLGLAVTKEEFYTKVKNGQVLFASGNNPIQETIEGVLRCPFSHVAFVWLPFGETNWLVIQATFRRGVNVCLLSDYVDKYNGSLVLTENTAWDQEDKFNFTNAALSLLEADYGVGTDISIALHKWVSFIPIDRDPDDKVCSTLMQYASTFTKTPFVNKDSAGVATPKDNWLEETIIPICSYTVKEG